MRNALLGFPATDIDLSTDARPAVVTELAEGAGLKVLPTGIDHGTVTVLVDHQPFEVTTFRKDVATDGRRAVVEFSDTIEEDARRRDFTMNALYADREGAVIDPLGGLNDLLERRVRFIGDPHDRIREDYLRILRFFRFHAWYGDNDEGIDPEGLAACAEHVEGLDHLPAERVGQEIIKLLSAPNPAPALASMNASGVLSNVLPGASVAVLAPLVHLEDSFGIEPDPMRRLAVLGAATVERLRISKAQTKILEILAGPSAEPAELGYRLGARLGVDKLLVDAARQGNVVTDSEHAVLIDGATQVFPLKAADLPHLQGKDLGDALKAAEDRWVRSRFTLGSSDLLS